MGMGMVEMQIWVRKYYNYENYRCKYVNIIPKT